MINEHHLLKKNKKFHYRTAGNIGENFAWRLAYKSLLPIAFTLAISVLHPSVQYGHPDLAGLILTV